MERKRTFGQEVKSLRKQRGWSQKELAHNVSDISPRTLGKIERGEKPFVDHTMVTRLASAFNLEGLAREEFFSHAGLTEGNSGEVSVVIQNDPVTVKAFYKSVAFPAYIHDSFLTLHSVNSSMLALFGIQVEDYHLEMLDPSGPHILRTMFEIQFEARTNWSKNKAWREHAEMLVYRFRLFTRKHLGSQKYIDLLSDLKRRPEFKEIWHKIEKPDYVPHFPTLSVFYLKTGEELHFIMTVAADTAFINSEANKVVFIPADEPTRQYLAHQASQAPYFYLVFDNTQHQGYKQVKL